MRRLWGRYVRGVIAIIVGCTTIGVTALVHASASTDPPVWLAIGLSDASNGQFSSGSPVTVTANIADSSTTTTGTDFSGTTTTATIANNAHPTVLVNFSTAALSFSTNGPGWGCGSPAAGSETCSITSNSGLLSVGSTASVPLVFSVVGNPGAPASVTASVVGNGVEANQAGPAGTATDSASVANPTSFGNGVPAGSFPQEVGGDQIVQAGSQTFTFSDTTANVTVTLPNGALPVGTHVSVYRANPGLWSSSASSSSQTFVDGYAVGWANSTTTAQAASSSITLDVSDSGVASTDTLHRATSTGIGSATGNVMPGGWSVAFTDDPGFILLHGTTTTQTSSTTTSQTSSTTTSQTSSTPTPIGPELEISSVIAKRAKHGRLAIRATTKNIGNRTSPQTTTAFYLRPAAHRHRSRNLASRVVPPLAPGQTARQRATVGIPTNLAADRYRVEACADITHKVNDRATSRCRLSTLIITIHKHHGHGAFVSYSDAPPPPQHYVLIASPPGHTRMVPIMLLLVGVTSVLIGITLVGLRRRTPIPAIQPL
jgi:hypothetical protein